MNHLKLKILIFLIILLAFLLRIFLLDKIPNSISADEAAFGYNAYSILKTGRDEFGVKYPLLFRSFDDHKNPVFVYLLVPFVSLFGLTEWAIRLPSVILGLGIVWLFYLVSLELIKNTKLALLMAFFAAISPWLIAYSRISLEVTTAVFFSLLGVWLFLKQQKNSILIIFSMLSFGLAFWTYYSSKLWIVLFVPALLIFKKKISKSLIFGLFIFGVILYPYVQLYRSSNILLRQYGISVFSQEVEKYQSSQDILFDTTHGLSVGKILHNRRLVFVNQIIEGYLNILGPQHLFSRNQSNQIPSTRLFYLWQIPLLLIGFLCLVRFRSVFILLCYWLIIGFLPGAITIFPPLDRRILIISFPLLLFIAYGFLWLQSALRSRIKKYYPVLTTVLVILIVSSFYCYTHLYYLHGRETVVQLWGNGMKELVYLTSQNREKYNNIIVSIKLNQPLTFFLFFESYDPVKYLEEGGTISGGYLDENATFMNYKFMNITPNNLTEKNLYVWDAREEQPCLKESKTIKRSDTSILGYIGHFDPDLKGCQKWLIDNKIN